MQKYVSGLKLLSATALVAAITFAAPDAHAKRSVGLGVGLGAAIPSFTGAESLGLDPALAWGFYTDIPLLSSFSITPSTLVYQLDPSAEGADSKSATDVSLSFKFVVPLGRLDLFAGVTAGVTSTDQLDPHVGLLAGGSLNLVSNLDVFVNASYRRVLGDGNSPDVDNIQVFVGPLIRFDY